MDNDNKKSNLVISISGDPGSGKSTVKDLLVEQCKNDNIAVEEISIGEIFREMAKTMNKSISEFNDYVKAHPEVDKMIDDRIVELGKKIKEEPFSNKVYIFDSRMAWKFIPDSLKVRLSVDPVIAGERVFNAKRDSEDSYKNIEDAAIETYKRKLHEIERYKGKYDVDLGDTNNYDLVINTSYCEPKDVANVIQTCAQYKHEDKSFAKLWRSPKTLFPTHLLYDSESADHKKTSNSLAQYGFLPEKPISAISVDGHYYVYNGHNRTLASLDNGIGLIAYTIDGKDDEIALLTDDDGNKLPGCETARQASQNLNDSQYYCWEDSVRPHGSFRFPTYPWLPKSELLQKIDKLDEKRKGKTAVKPYSPGQNKTDNKTIDR